MVKGQTLCEYFFRSQGRLTIHYENSFFQAAQRHPGVPPLSPGQLEAITEFDRVDGSSPVRLDYWLEVGDIQLLNNHTTVHTRTGYTDWGVRDRTNPTVTIYENNRGCWRDWLGRSMSNLRPPFSDGGFMY